MFPDHGRNKYKATAPDVGHGWSDHEIQTLIIMLGIPSN